MSTKLSVIMSVYNGAEYLDKSVNGILNQTFSNYEFIIIDDGSTDDTWHALSKFRDPRICLLRNRKNLGLTRSLNKGLNRAQGEYIARQDVDDISLPERLDKQVKRLDENSSVVLVGSSIRYIDNLGNKIRESFRSENADFNRWQLYFGNYVTHSTAMFRRAVALKSGGYDKNFRYAQDYELWSRLNRSGDVVQIRDVLLEWRKHEDSISFGKVALQNEAVVTALQCHLADLLGKTPSAHEIRHMRAFARYPMSSREELEMGFKLLNQIRHAFFSRWVPTGPGRRCINRDLALRMLKARQLNFHNSSRLCRDMILRALRYDPYLLMRKMLDRIFRKPIHGSTDSKANAI